MREVRAELRKVAWPTRPEVKNYSIIVLITVLIFMALVTGLDIAFAKGILWLFQLIESDEMNPADIEDAEHIDEAAEPRPIDAGRRDEPNRGRARMARPRTLRPNLSPPTLSMPRPSPSAPTRSK